MTLLQPALFATCHTQPTIEVVKFIRTTKKFHLSTTSKATSQAQNSKPNFYSKSNSSRDTVHQSAPNPLSSNVKPTYAHATSRKNTTPDSETQDSTASKFPNLTSLTNLNYY
jgi:hypothetical protein